MTSLEKSSDGAMKNRSGEATGLILKHVPGTYGICRLGARARIPRWVHRSIFFSVCRSPDELSILCEERLVPKSIRCERGWSAIRVVGTLDFSLIGVLASLAQPLADARIGLFTVSTFDTDYLLVREKRLDDAVAVLEAAGHTFKQQAPAAEDEQEASTVEDKKPQDAPEGDQLEAEKESVENAAQAAPEKPEVEPAALEPPKLEPPAAEIPAVEPAPKPPQQKRKSAFARVLAEFGLGSKEPEETTAEGDDRSSRESGEASAAREEPTVEAPPARAVDAEPTSVAESEPDLPEPPAIVESPPETPSEAVSSEPTDEASAAAPEATTPDAAADVGARAEGLFTGAIPQHPVEITDQSFADLGLSGPILETVREVGFEHPTPIQVKVIPVAFEGFDIIGLAETGSGKTAAFSLPLAERLTHGKGTRGLILCPTREIALQTKAFLDIFGRDHELETVAVIGGVKMGPQIDGFRRDADILVATPGRLADHLRRRNVSLDRLEELVLDEADHMLDLGFLPQIKEILEQVPESRRTMMFSATMPPPIERLAQHFMKNPVRCDIRPEGQLATGIEHRLYLVKDEDRKDCLLALLKEIEGSTLIFIRRKLYTEWLARQLDLAGFPVARIHSDRSQAQRVKALRAFREGKVRILVATDVAARGIDVPLIQHVINYGLPEQVGDYVHRAGRTARGTAGGIVSTIGTWQDKLMVRDIELDLGITMPRCVAEGVEPYRELPKRKTVRRRRLL